MTTPLLFFILGCVSAFIASIFSYRIASFLDEAGEEIKFINLRWHMTKYLRMYKEATLRKNGRIGHCYYLVYISWFATVTFFVLMIGAKLKAL